MSFFNDTELARRKDQVVRMLPRIPDTGWRPPKHFPDLRECAVIGVDVETYDPDLLKFGPGWGRGVGWIVGVSIAAIAKNGERGKWYLPVRHEVEKEYNLDAKHVFNWLREQLHTPRIPKVFANALYDIGWLTTEGIYCEGEFHDVQFAEPLLNDADEVSLEYLGTKYLNRGKTTDQLFQWCADAYGKPQNGGDQRANIYRAPPRLVGPYAEDDADMPLDIMLMQFQELNAQNLMPVYRMECDLIPLLIRMRLAGVTIDLNFAEKLYNELSPKIKELYAKLAHDFGHKIEKTSSTQLSKLFDHVGIEYPRTGAGNGSFRKEFLKGLHHPVADAINEIREHEKIRGTFVESYLLRANINGKIHCQFHPLRSDEGGTITGRFSSSTPNLQNIPSRTELGRRVRKAFVKDKGHYNWRKIDYCVAPHARILTTDMRHIRADEVQIGQELVGFDEFPTGGKSKSRRMMKRAKVISTKKLIQPALRIRTESGRILDCSSAHKWLAKSGYSGTYEFRASNTLLIGDMIPSICEVWEPDNTYDAGWLAGIFDGEGWRSNGMFGVAQNPGLILDRIKSMLNAREIEYVQKNTTKSNAQTLLLQGGRSATWKLLGQIRPVRLLQKNATLIDKIALQSRTAKHDKIISIQDMGQCEVIAIETDCSTFVCEGLASHNSQIEYRCLAHYAVDRGDGSAERLRQTYINNPKTDYHKFVMIAAAPYLGKDLATMTKDQIELFRKPIKNVNFGLLYGEGVDSLAYKIGFKTTDEAKEFFKGYHEAAPYVKPTLQHISALANRQGYIETILGRRTRFNLWEPNGWGKKGHPMPYDAAVRNYGTDIRRAYTFRAVNYCFQGSGTGDVIKAAMLQAWQSGVYNEIGIPRLQVHDELDHSLIDDPAMHSEAWKHYTHILEHSIPQLRIPVMVDIKDAPTWGDIN